MTIAKYNVKIFISILILTIREKINVWEVTVMANNDLAVFYFHQGTNFLSYDFLGCTLVKTNGEFVYTFRVWSPSSERVFLVSDFCGWDVGIEMKKITEGGIWELEYISDKSIELAAYKFRIVSGDKQTYKADPYARFSRGGADGASLIYTESKFEWQDSAWMRARKKKVASKSGYYLASPINIYEVHAGSFARHDDNTYYTYRELAHVLVPYLKFMGYTHIEFLPLAEFPYDGSWGYQVCGFYAPTSRFGTPDDFRYMINEFHKNGIGVILDWVPAHFPKDAWGLYEFDGAPTYEYQGSDRIESRSWGTRFFDVGREEVQSFLISCALYYFREFHVDGLRVDAVASMLYLDYDKEPGAWIPNSSGTNINLESVAFLRKLNSAIFAEFPDALMIAEESGDYGAITKPVSEGGLGFNLKWNMGWANDFYDYLMTDPVNRNKKHSALNFPIMYSFTENYVLPISHDEVVHGKLSFINKMYGSYEDKFRQARVALMLMMTYPGKKMLFMGTEYAQFREWDFESSLEWFMLDYPNHKEFRNFTASLNRFYLEHPELWEIDFSSDGFEWIYADESDKNIVAFRRKDIKGNYLTVVLSFSGVNQSITLPLMRSELRCVFASEYGLGTDAVVAYRKSKCGQTQADLTVPAFSGMIFNETDGLKIKFKEKDYVL